MNLDASKFKVDEGRSNPMAVAMQYADCPISQICFYMVTGFGTIAEQCQYFREEGERGECVYKESVQGV